MSDGSFVTGCVPSEAITLVERALAVPAARVGKVNRPHSVVDAAGAPVVDAGSFAHKEFIGSVFIDRDTVGPVEMLEGSYLFAGFYRPHFGHFLFESISRLWAVDGLRGRIKGIVFFRMKPTEVVSPHLQRILDLLDIDLPLIFVDAPVAFERLYVPRQGSAMGPLSPGTPAFRHFVQSKLRRIPAREGAEKVYLTRERYQLRRGGLFGEDLLRSQLESHGYVAFAPERHSFEEQVATYLGAAKIIGPDSSALHLVGYVARPETEVAIVLRRPEGAVDLLPQIAGFTGRKPLVVDAITQMLRRDNERNDTWAHFAEVHFPKVWHDLTAAGFIEGGDPWSALRPGRRLRMIDFYQRRLGGTLVPLWERPRRIDLPRRAAPVAAVPDAEDLIQP